MQGVWASLQWNMVINFFFFIGLRTLLWDKMGTLAIIFIETLLGNAHRNFNSLQTCFSWFSSCLSDLEPSTQRELFQERLLQLDRGSLSTSAFTCFVDYFHAINLNERKIVKSGANKMVRLIDLNIYYTFISNYSEVTFFFLRGSDLFWCET